MTVFALSLLLATLSYGVWCRWHFGLVDERQAAERYDLELDRTRFHMWARDLTAREQAVTWDRKRLERWGRNLTEQAVELASKTTPPGKFHDDDIFIPCVGWCAAEIFGSTRPHLYDQGTERATVEQTLPNTYRCHAALDRIDEAAE